MLEVRGGGRSSPVRSSSRGPVAAGVAALLLAVPLSPPAWAATTGSAGSVEPRTGGPAPAEPGEGAKDVEAAVVKVFATVRSPDLTRPWTKQAPREVSGSGVVIAGKRILTNAHVVLYASEVQIQPNQSGDKLSASVEWVAPGIDLAVLKLDDDAFFRSHAPLACASGLPEIRDPVMAYGFPAGGTSLSITKGIVSRIEFAGYNYPSSGLRIQIDAAINPGNSGGPAVSGDRMVGIAFSVLGGTQNIGYIIPCEEIALFLQDVASGAYHGKPAMFDDLQTLESPALRSFLKLEPTVEGIVVSEPFRSDAAYPLKKWDVITRIGDTKIDDQGMIGLGKHLRVEFRYLVQKLAAGGKVPLTVVRGGREVAIQLPVSPRLPMLLPQLQGAYPSYFIAGPLVFSPATREFLFAFNSGKQSLLPMLSYTGSPLVTRLADAPAFEGEQLVVVSSPFLPHRLAKGYSNPMTGVVQSVNGLPVKSLRHLVEILRDARDPYVVVEFARKHVKETLVFPRSEMLAATNDILNDNGIRSQGSPDMLKVWGEKPAP